MSVAIRRAGPADATTLAALGARTFEESFGHLYAAEDLQAFLAENHDAGAYAGWLADPAYGLWLVEDRDLAIGYAMAGPGSLPHAEVRPEDGELKRLYLLASAQGTGIGARLFGEVLAWLERDGPRTLWISVWSENHGAQRLYARHGFEKAGEYEFVVGRHRDHEFMYRRCAQAA